MRMGLFGLLADSIRGRLILLVAGFVVSASLLAALLVVESHWNERELIEQQLTETSRALSLVLDRQLGQSEALLRALATSPSLNDGEFEAFHRQAESVFQDRDRWIVLVDREGQQIVNTRAPIGTDLPSTMLPPDFWSDLERGALYVSDLVSSPIVSRPVVTVAVPVVLDGEVAYGLSVVMLPSALSDVLDDLDFPEAWVAAIIDREGTIVARTRRAEEFVGKPATDDIRAALQRRDRDVVESVTLDGVRSLAAFNRSPTFGLAVIIGAPRSVLYRSARDLLMLVIAVSLLLIVLGVGVSGWVARGVVRSVEALAAGAGAIGRGEVPALAPTGLRETDEVADVLRDSAARLEAREGDLRRLNDALEGRVRERTAQVQALASTLTRAEQEERRRISQVLHDDLQQILYGAQVKISLLQKAASRAEYVDVDRVLKDVETVDQWIGQAIDLTRRLTVDLSPPVLKGAGFHDAIDWLAGQIEEVHGLRVDVTAMESFSVPDEDTRVLLFQIVRELLFNVVKHAGTAEAVVDLLRTDDAVVVEVADRGLGFAVEEAEARYASGGGFGLFSVRERLMLFGGHMEIASAPGEGTRVTVRVPIGEEPADTSADRAPARAESVREA